MGGALAKRTEGIAVWGFGGCDRCFGFVEYDRCFGLWWECDRFLWV
ncbi:MAG: hypothetical protein ACKO3K_15610 [Cuspidothrix sp.]